MEVSILYGGALFLVGWLWFYLFGRQFLFNILTAFPLIKKMQAIDAELIAPGAKKYTLVSVGVCTVVTAIAFAVVIVFCSTILKIGFFAGAIVGLLSFFGKLTPENKPMFETFCNAYYRFVPDDELRTAMYNKKYPQMKTRLRAMGFIDTFIPEFKK